MNPEAAGALTTLPRAFYLRPTAEVARDLLGRYLVLQCDGAQRRIGLLVETEAYVGEQDQASHASHGRTKRTAPMYEEAGRVYIYLVYGMHWCLNVVTEDAGTPCAVLLRGAEPVEGLADLANGPGKLCRAFGLDGRWNREDLTQGRLVISHGEPFALENIGVSARVGVAYAGAWANEPLRFFVS
ncbi:MAG: 3-methyladenine glycosylase, partial [Chloroflexi bacterium]|nr:3-methyladenine glycosylase [Chloroflexota bacterium]